MLLLMLMYYVVFAGSDVSPVMVAVAAFSLHMSAYTAACFYSAINATDAMQVEAARTLGFFRWQAFTLITLPQTAKIAKETYQSTIVTLIQWTSVVGYVTITDLTRVINNIGSRTMQPLFYDSGGTAAVSRNGLSQLWRICPCGQTVCVEKEQEAEGMSMIRVEKIVQSLWLVAGAERRKSDGGKRRTDRHNRRLRLREERFCAAWIF